MTYWPISSPSVFAATKNTQAACVHTSHDGLELGTRARNGQHELSSPNKAGSEQQDQGGILENAKQSNSLKSDNDAAQHGKEEEEEELQAAEDDVSGGIIAIRVTRTGNMFATITRSTLTIWQTKACLGV